MGLFIIMCLVRLQNDTLARLFKAIILILKANVTQIELKKMNCWKILTKMSRNIEHQRPYSPMTPRG